MLCYNSYFLLSYYKQLSAEIKYTIFRLKPVFLALAFGYLMIVPMNIKYRIEFLDIYYITIISLFLLRWSPIGNVRTTTRTYGWTTSTMGLRWPAPLPSAT